MAIQKKSLLKTLKTVKKAKVASAPISKSEAGTTQKSPVRLLARQTGAMYTRSFVKI